jgi:hypothetical protein
VFENWRSVVAPPGLTRAERDRLAGAVDRMVRSTAWREALERYRWLDRYLAGDAFTQFVGAEERRVRGILRKLGTDSDTSAAASTGPYPLFVIGGLLLCGIFLRFGPVSPKRRILGSAKADGLSETNSVTLVAAGFALHLLLVQPAGFVVASAVLFWMTARAFDHRHPLRDAVAAIVVSAAAYILFARVLDVSLPAGVLAGWI